MKAVYLMTQRKSLGIALAAALLEFAARSVAVHLGAKLSANPGVAFGLLGGRPALACALSALALAALLFCLSRFPRPGLAIMAGGAAANLLDRLLWGAVRDWIPLPFSEHFIPGGLRFNLADVEIALGAAAVLWGVLKKGRDDPSPQQS